MQLSLQNFSTLVDNMAATVQGSCASLINLTVGSVLRGILEASASVALWLQYLLLQILTTTRLATSVGSDADSWVQDFGMTRLPAARASGSVTFSSFNPSSQAATIPSGATVRTSDGSQTFTVVDGPYTRALGVPDVEVQVQALVAGTDGNVQGNTITILGTAISGIDTVNNAAALTGGTSVETDASLRLRFVRYINTRSQATRQAFEYAVSSVRQGLSFSIQENILADGTAQPGHVNVIVDDGSGRPDSSLLAEVAAALDLVRPIGTSVLVNGPQLVTAAISATVTAGAALDPATVRMEVTAALTGYVDALAVGQVLRFSRLAGLCYGADDAITNVEHVTLNNDVQDVGGGAGSVVRIGTIVVAVVAA